MVTLPVTAALGVVAAAAAVRYVGADTYGFVSLVAQLVLLLPFADLGLGASITRRVAQWQVGTASTSDVASLIRRAMATLGVVGVLAATLAILLAATEFWSRLFDAPAAISHGVNWITALVLSIFFLSLPIAIAQRILVGLDRSALLVFIGFVPPALNLAFILLAGALGWPPMIMAMGTVIGTSMGAATGALFAFVPRMGGIGLLGQRATSRARTQLLEIVRSAVPMLIAGAGTAAAFQSGRIVLSNFGSPPQLTEYALAFQLYLPLFSVIYMGSTVLWPRFATGGGLRLWASATLGLTAVGAAAGVGYVAVAPVLVNLMSGGTVSLSSGVAWSFALLLTVQGLFATQGMAMTDERGLVVQAALSVTLALVALPLSAWLSSAIGAAGPSLSAAAASFFALTVPSILYTHRRLSRNRLDNA